MNHSHVRPLTVLLLTAVVLGSGCSRKAQAPQPSPQPTPQAAPPQPPRQDPGPAQVADFRGEWVCVHGNNTIPGAVTQNGSQVQGYCIYPGNHRATFSGTVRGNTLSGTLDVPHQNKQWPIEATLSGNAMTGTWGGSNGWAATRK